VTGQDLGELHLGVRGVEAELKLKAPRSKVPAGEFARVVARFCATTGGHCRDEEAMIRVVRGAIMVYNGPIQARTSADGLRFRARWPLANL
jgi:hypothetical protein